MQQHMGPPQHRPTSNGLGIAAFVTSLVSLVACCGVLSPISLILGIIAAMKRPRGFAIASIVLSILGVLLIVAYMVLPLLVIGLLGGLFAAIGFGSVIAEFQGAAIAANVEQYIQDQGTVPATLASVPELDQSIIEDPWGNDFIYRPDPTTNTYELRSAGPDGQPDTGDDIVIDTDALADLFEQPGAGQGSTPDPAPAPGSAPGPEPAPETPNN